MARHSYYGPITYGADYTDYTRVTFWGSITDVGLDAYFPLSTTPNPTVPQLSHQWNRIASRIEAWRRKSHLASKPFLITELGYPSESGAALNPGSWSPRQPVNLSLQKHLYQATFRSIWPRSCGFGGPIRLTLTGAVGLTTTDTQSAIAYPASLTPILEVLF